MTALKQIVDLFVENDLPPPAFQPIMLLGIRTPSPKFPKLVLRRGLFMYENLPCRILSL